MAAKQSGCILSVAERSRADCMRRYVIYINNNCVTQHDDELYISSEMRWLVLIRANGCTVGLARQSAPRGRSNDADAEGRFWLDPLKFAEVRTIQIDASQKQDKILV